MMSGPILIVGAGFAGSTIARILADYGLNVDIIDKRSHVGGNAYDFINNHSERIHKYGPHLLHGDSSSSAVKFLSRFTEWTYYEHRVRALLKNGSTTPLPVNQATLEDVFNICLEDEIQTEKFLNSLRCNHITPSNCDQMFLASYGTEISDIFFRPYTKKMWGIDPSDLSVEVGKRLPFRLNRDDRYFTDNFQALPDKGYTNMFEKMLDHPRIKLKLDVSFEKCMIGYYDHVFLSLPIDEYFEFKLGSLPYRSILFHHVFSSTPDQAAPVINFTDESIFTRVTQWSLLPNSGKASSASTFTYEQPCDISQNPGEYYYPVRNKQSIDLYQRYVNLAAKEKKITFCGRAGLFMYIDMIPAVNIHMKIAKDYLKGLHLKSSV